MDLTTAPVLVHLAAVTVADAADGTVVVHTEAGPRRGHLSDAGAITLPPGHYLSLWVPRGIAVDRAWESLRAAVPDDPGAAWVPTSAPALELHHPEGVELYLPVALPLS